jgi:hypothetical protein
MSARPANPLVLHTLLGLILLIGLQVLLPGGTEWWRRVLTGILSVSYGYQLATAFVALNQSRTKAAKAFIESFAFPLLIAGFLWVPAAPGWILLAAGPLWRPISGLLWHKP